MRYCYITDPGKVRERNEDSVTILKNGDEYLLAVADGMGGHKNGEIASSIALNHLVIPLGRRSRGTRDPTIAATVVGRRPTYDRFTVLWLFLSHFSSAVG